MPIVDADDQLIFLEQVGLAHGNRIRDACEEILKRKAKQGEAISSPLAVLGEAQQICHSDQLRAAAVGGVRHFDSDGDL